MLSWYYWDYYLPNCGGDSQPFSTNQMPTGLTLPANSNASCGGGDGKGYWSWSVYSA
jgi:hypothetical protein